MYVLIGQDKAILDASIIEEAILILMHQSEDHLLKSGGKKFCDDFKSTVEQ